MGSGQDVSQAPPAWQAGSSLPLSAANAGLALLG